MLPRIVLKCFVLINLSTIYCFNVIKIKNLNENRLVNKLTELVHRVGNEGITSGLEEIKSILRRHPLNEKLSDYDNKEESYNHDDEDSGEGDDKVDDTIEDDDKRVVQAENDNKEDSQTDDDSTDDNAKSQDPQIKNIDVTKENNESDVGDETNDDSDEIPKRIVMPQEEIVISKESQEKNKKRSISKIIENEPEVEEKKLIGRSKHTEHDKDKHKHEKSHNSNSKKVATTTETPGTFSPLKKIWNSLRNWFRRNSESTVTISDAEIKTVIKRIINIMRSSERNGKKKTANSKSINPLREQRSGEAHDPLAPGKLPHHVDTFHTTTARPMVPWHRPHSFWNYWTYAKEIYQDNCRGEGLIQVGNVCIDKFG